ncbi:MAG: methylated-DNA-[protein]-cysteine S-methyltransferase [Gaiellaceae bacterium]|jgi:methylated-DNA-[protein]-cysteine S-methyltransferase|nr:methylated-DNA-[protein]-cysteine S-methyltransferase [Gaiellaceae bacterium]
MRVTRHPYEVEGWGVGELWVGDGEVVVAHDPPTPGVRLHGALRQSVPQKTPQTISRGIPGAPTETLSPEPWRNAGGFVPDLLRSIHSYFRGEPVSFADVPLDGDWATPFQEALADALRHVPWGEVVSYGELSALAGRRRAARAAGTFCAENRFSLFVPCHRVVAAGGIGGYGSLGVEYKRRLLNLEGWQP